MKTTASVFLVSLLLSLSSDAAIKHSKKQKKPAPEPVTIALISLPKFPQRFVEASVNGGARQLFLMDTSSSGVALFDWYVETLRIPSDQASPPKTETPNENKIKKATLASIQFGESIQENLAVVVLQDPGVFKKLNVVGVINPLLVLNNEVFTIDFKQNLIVFDSKLKKPLRVQADLKSCELEAKMLAPASINGANGFFELNSGISNSFVSNAFAEKGKIKNAKEAIRFGGKKFTSAKFQINDNGSSCEKSSGVLGMNTLEGMRITYLKDRKKIVFEK